MLLKPIAVACRKCNCLSGDAQVHSTCGKHILGHLYNCPVWQLVKPRQESAQGCRKTEGRQPHRRYQGSQGGKPPAQEAVFVHQGLCHGQPFARKKSLWISKIFCNMIIQAFFMSAMGVVFHMMLHMIFQQVNHFMHWL